MTKTERTISSEATKQVGKKILLKGWLHTLRLLGTINFLVLRDRGGFIQIVVSDKEEIKKIKDLETGSILTVEGKVQKSDQTEIGVEVVDPKITIEVPVTEVPPIEINKKEIRANLDTILENRPIALRNEREIAIFKIQAVFLKAYREFLTQNGFTEYFGPTIIGASSEGGAELFTVDYFGHSAKLSQSSQLYKQVMVGVFERTFALMKCYRAEKSNTVRHITEATQCEFEMGFIDGLETILDWEEKIMKYIVKTIKKECACELKYFGNVADLPESTKIPRITLEEAQEIFYKRTKTDIRREDDLTPDAEKELSTYAKETAGCDFVFVTHFPRKKVAFYARPNEKNPEITDYADLLCNGAEVTSGGRRIDKYEELVESLKLKGLDPQDFTDYLSIFKFGMPPHGGFGLGMERFTKQFLGLENIREATLFPSDMKRIAAVKIKIKPVLGGEKMVEAIKQRLTKEGREFKHLIHEPTPTSEDSSKIRGTKMEEGIKAIILKGKKTEENYMVCIPSHMKIDMKAIAEQTGEQLEFERPEKIKESFGLMIGGVPPFGNLLGIQTYFDKKILDEERAVFNAGLQTDSIIMKSKDLIETADPTLGDFST
ncbi:aspartate--tRNA(Asn) ligase [Candidatus Dojkabacteria bacterium]|nr:aspartate--tRNA(Asn) ligase [Candidatus Dojkabacteria bacterium]